MSTPDLTPTEAIATVGETDAARIAALETSLRRHRLWLAVLTAIIGLSVVSVVGLVAMMSLGFDSVMGDMEVGDESVAEAKSAIQAAYGDRLRDIEVRTVTLKYEDTPFPFSFMGGGDVESLYIQYGLKGSTVTVADYVEGGVFGEELTITGMLPTKGSLTSRMTPEQFDRLLTAYANETKEPLGSVRRYGDPMYPLEPGSPVQDEVKVGGKAYPSAELWSANEGRVLEGTEVDLSLSSDMGRKAFIFHEDPVTGDFTFLGTEMATGLW